MAGEEKPITGGVEIPVNLILDGVIRQLQSLEEIFRQIQQRYAQGVQLNVSTKGAEGVKDFAQQAEALKTPIEMKLTGEGSITRLQRAAHDLREELRTVIAEAEKSGGLQKIGIALSSTGAGQKNAVKIDFSQGIDEALAQVQRRLNEFQAGGAIRAKMTIFGPSQSEASITGIQNVMTGVNVSQRRADENAKYVEELRSQSDAAVRREREANLNAKAKEGAQEKSFESKTTQRELETNLAEARKQQADAAAAVRRELEANLTAKAKEATKGKSDEETANRRELEANLAADRTAARQSRTKYDRTLDIQTPEQADTLQRALRDIQAAGGMPRVDVRAPGVRQNMAAGTAEQATAAAEELKGLLGTLSKEQKERMTVRVHGDLDAASIKATQGLNGLTASVGKASGGVGRLMDAWDRFAAGESLRRVVAAGTHSTLTNAFGESKLVDAIAGGVGILAGSVLLRFGWMIGDVLLNLPHIISTEVSAQRDAQTLRLRSLSPDDKGNNEWTQAAQRGRMYWSGFDDQFGKAGGAQQFEAAMRAAQIVAPEADVDKQGVMQATKTDRVNQQNVEKFAWRAMRLAFAGKVNDPAQFAAELEKLEKTRDPKLKQKILGNEFVMEEMVQRYKKLYPTMARADLEKLITTEAGHSDEWKSRRPQMIDTAEVQNAVATVAQSTNMGRHEKEITQQWHWARMRETWANLFPKETQIDVQDFEVVKSFANAKTEKDRAALREEYSKQHTRTEVIVSPYGDEFIKRTVEKGLDPTRLKRLEELSNRLGGDMKSGPDYEDPMKAHHLNFNARYAMTSLTGLVEKMQNEAASQMFNYEQQTADNTKNAVVALESIKSDVSKMAENTSGTRNPAADDTQYGPDSPAWGEGGGGDF